MMSVHKCTPSSMDIIQDLMPTNTACFNVNSPKENQMAAATIECKFSKRHNLGVLEVF